VKSWIVKVTVTVWDSVPLVPVTVTVSFSAVGELHESVEVPVVPRVTLVGLRLQVALPVAATVRLTVPEKPPMLVTVIVEVPVAPALTVILRGLAVTLKSTVMTVTDTVAEWDSGPLVPVTVTV
jgi:hypothetical protein